MITGNEMLGNPRSMSVTPHACDVTKMLSDRKIIIHPSLRIEFQELVGKVPPKVGTLTRWPLKQPLSTAATGLMRSAQNQSTDEKTELWVAAALVMNQPAGGDGDLDLANPNVLISMQRLIYMAYGWGRQVWEVCEIEDLHVFPENTVMVSFLR